MIHVRRHKRATASGKTVTVRAHERDGGDGVREAPGWAQPASVSDFGRPAEPEPAAGDWWDDAGDVSHDLALARMKQEMREWRSLPEPDPLPDEPVDPQMARLLGCDTPEGRANYDRLRAYREAGYDGPLDQDSRIPDPDDPANAESLSALARMSEL